VVRPETVADPPDSDSAEPTAESLGLSDLASTQYMNPKTASGDRPTCPKAVRTDSAMLSAQRCDGSRTATAAVCTHLGTLRRPTRVCVRVGELGRASRSCHGQDSGATPSRAANFQSLAVRRQGQQRAVDSAWLAGEGLVAPPWRQESTLLLLPSNFRAWSGLLPVRRPGAVAARVGLLVGAVLRRRACCARSQVGDAGRYRRGRPGVTCRSWRAKLSQDRTDSAALISGFWLRRCCNVRVPGVPVLPEGRARWWLCRCALPLPGVRHLAAP